ncbi:hypothetical protein EDB86DRAFT_2953674 [Lactarius hatsudake]|nr:hypothetical protein EDB86DRAFT_2960836 [Lactarius hatsudake]KAH8986824.1 hypothetical protein EDB86DRAFT_2953674 [Lactarius hatsudake]
MRPTLCCLCLIRTTTEVAASWSRSRRGVDLDDPTSNDMFYTLLARISAPLLQHIVEILVHVRAKELINTTAGSRLHQDARTHLL